MGLVPAGLEFQSGTKTRSLWKTAKCGMLATSQISLLNKDNFFCLFIFCKGVWKPIFLPGKTAESVQAALDTRLHSLNQTCSLLWRQFGRVGMVGTGSLVHPEQSWAQLVAWHNAATKSGGLFAVMKTGQAVSRLPSCISLCRLPVDTWLGIWGSAVVPAASGRLR